MKIAIIGYGNLGKAVEKRAKEMGIDIAGIYSRRQIISVYGTKTYHTEFFDGNCDVAMLCVGSANDIENIAPQALARTNIIDAFDNHGKIRRYVGKMDYIAREKGKVAIVGAGWDTGLFSNIRALTTLVTDKQSTYWGKGISQGHTNALKSIEGVIDAVQFTLPKYEKGNELFPIEQRHRRICYVVAQENADKSYIVNTVLGLKNYFYGYETQINFVDQKTVNKLKKNTFHAGKIVGISAGNRLNFNLKMKDNCYLTAGIMLRYIGVIERYLQSEKYGAFTILDISPADLIGEQKWNYL